MRPGEYPLTLYRGDSYRWQFALWTDPEHTTPMDLTGVVASAEIRESSGSHELVPMTCIVTLPNLITVDLPAQAWATYHAPWGIWDLQLSYPDAVLTVLAGQVTVRPDATDSDVVLSSTGGAPWLA